MRNLRPADTPSEPGGTATTRTFVLDTLRVVVATILDHVATQQAARTQTVQPEVHPPHAHVGARALCHRSYGQALQATSMQTMRPPLLPRSWHGQAVLTWRMAHGGWSLAEHCRHLWHHT